MPYLDLGVSFLCHRNFEKTASQRPTVKATKACNESAVDEPGEVKTFNLPYFLSLNHVCRIYRGHPGQWKPLELLL